MPTQPRATSLTQPQGFRIYASNRLETLVAKLAETMGDDPLGPLEREVVVVQSRGMYRWLTLELAKRLGIAATIATPFPGTFCRALAERIEGKLAAGPAERYEPAGPSLFDREVLAWRVFRLLRDGPLEARGPAAAYIKDDPDQRKRFQLATRLAEHFDEYQLYRPDLLLTWEAGEQPITTPSHRETATWQAALWRALVTEAHAEDRHLARRFTELAKRLHESKTPPPGLPRRVSVFGASSLPPIFLDLLVALARFASVSVYVVSPTREYWSDIRSPREAAKQLDMFREKGLADEYAHVDVGHPLLASLGRQGRELGGLLHEHDPEGSAWTDLDYLVPERTTVLGTIQADIVELVDRDHGAGRAARIDMPGGDRSVELHVCHSPMREMQVIRDVILDAFAADATLRPHDVFVLAPDIAKYAPYVEAVFGVSHEGEPALPFAIADRSARSEQPVVDAAFRVLEAVGGRATASDVLSLLDAAPVRNAAGILVEQLSTIREWVRTANIRWGMDGDHRRSTLDLPCDDVDTWRAGLDRLLMGYAIGDADTLVAGVLPRGAAAGEADVLGRFAAFTDRLFAHLRELASARTPVEWAGVIRRAIDDLIVADGEIDERALEQLRDAIDTLEEAESIAGVTENVALEVVRERLRSQMDMASGGAGFITGAITFCGLKPMRAIPAKVVCIVGLDAGQFPRHDRPASFDLIAAEHRPGDRSPRDDDRYAFLEAVLASRGRLILSYVGRSQKDNSDLAPSSVLSELLDVIDRTFTRATAAAGDSPPHVALTRSHALQPFSERYYSASTSPPATLFSYSRENRRAASALVAATGLRQLFVDAPLPLAEGLVDVALADLVEFWSHPSRHFCSRVLRLRVPGEDGEPENSEPFGADSLSDYAIVDRLVARRLADLPTGGEETQLLRAAFGLPHAGRGNARHARLSRTADEFTAALVAATGGKPVFRDPIAIDLPGAGWRLVGRIDRVTDRGLLHYRPAMLKPKDYLRAWIPHVAWSAWAATPQRSAGMPPPVRQETTLVGKDKVVSFPALENAGTILQQLIGGYLVGRSAPPPVFERASFAHAEQQHKLDAPGSKASASALSKAHAAFHGGGYIASRVDADDPHVRIVFRDRDPLVDATAEFEQLARDLWDPVLRAAVETALGETKS